MEEVKRLVPDYAALSVSAGAQMLREMALAELAVTLRQMEEQIQAAEQRFLRAQEDQAEDAQQAARTELARLQGQRAEKLKQLAQRLAEQIAALEQLKRE